MIDGVLLRHAKNTTEKELLYKFSFGWKLQGLNTVDEIIEGFKGAGFRGVSFVDRTDAIRKNASAIQYRGFLAYPLLKALHFFKLISKVELENVYATFSQKKMHEVGLFGYGIFSAEK